MNIAIANGVAWFWEKLFNYFVESKDIKNFISLGSSRELKYHEAKRFRNALCEINYCNELSNSSQYIYPKKIELKIEHQCIYASFLDLRITILDGIFIYKLCD